MISEKLKALLDGCKWDEALVFIQQCNMSLSDELIEKQAWRYSRTERYREAIKIYKVLLQKQPE